MKTGAQSRLRWRAGRLLSRVTWGGNEGAEYDEDGRAEQSTLAGGAGFEPGDAGRNTPMEHKKELPRIPLPVVNAGAAPR